jgi:predicted DCC family thiol-disulfide oxidoreductase YuxK
MSSTRFIQEQTMMPEGRFRLLFDGDCPLCKHEAHLLAWLDGGRSRLALEDISAPGFDAGRYGRSQDELMAEIHGLLPDGRLVKGMEVFRQAYAAVGFAWLLAPTGWPMIKPLADRAYAWFARNRMRLTGRGAACGTGHCHAPRP